ncbi:MAG TPA: glucose 1-dehydrogenase [Thermomicrobiales bacterium]|nr:glucose 1-dehydrogenase [Thermomicrobiales bacterium]
MSTATTRAIAFSPVQPGIVHTTTIGVPVVGEHDVEIDVLQVGVCGTDREIIAGDIGFPPPAAAELVLGHELAGRVRSVGPAVTTVQPGDLVSATVRRPDDCPSCQAGEPDMCTKQAYTERGIAGAHGFMAERIVEDERWVVPVPDKLESVAVLTEPLSVVEKGVRQARLIQQRLNYWEPETAVVIGAGPIGILGTLLLRSQGLDVWTIARTPAPNPKANLVTAAGATYVSGQGKSLSDVTTSIPPVDIVLECSGSSVVAFESIGLLANNGVAVFASVTPEDEEGHIPTGRLNRQIVAGNKVVVGTVNSGMVDFANAVSSLERFESLWPGLTGSMITHRFTLDDDPNLATGNIPGCIKCVIEFQR